MLLYKKINSWYLFYKFKKSMTRRAQTMQDQITDNTTNEQPLESAEVVDLRAEVMDSFEMYALQEFNVDDMISASISSSLVK